MNATEITVSVTAAANAIAAQLTNDQLNFLGAVLTLMGEMLQTIATIRPDPGSCDLEQPETIASIVG